MSTRRVIIADSSQNLLEGIRGLLGTIFDSVVMVADVKSLVDAVERLTADLLVIDLSLFAQRNADAVRTIKERFPDLKVIVLSIHDEPAALKKAVSVGAEGFVLKHEAARDLIPAVRAVLVGGTYASTLQKSPDSLN
jgi:DNA-binding NarL/FixJ family response regulator